MSTCLRPELGVLPARLQSLPLDKRGYPVPWFVAWKDGEPEFRAMDGAKLIRAVRDRLCWVCGQRLGAYMAFVVGPMCGINRTSAEPPSHLECAEWSAINCPFLSRPHAVRRQDDLINNARLQEESAGTALARNPGVTLLWVTRGYKVFDDGKGRPLIEMGEPTRVLFFSQGRPASRAEVCASVDSGIPALEAIAATQKGATEELAKYRRRFEALYPAEVEHAESA